MPTKLRTGVIGKKLFDELFKKGLKLITRKRKNMKEKLVLTRYEKQLLNQRNLIETVFDCLKDKYHVFARGSRGGSAGLLTLNHSAYFRKSLCEVRIPWALQIRS